MSRGGRERGPGTPATRPLRVLLGAALLASGLGSCFNLRWERQHRFEALRPERIQAVEVGRSDLGECLEVLGAPLYVWELPGGAFSIAYGWSGDRNLGGTARVPLARFLSPSYSYDERHENLYGLVLLFDADATLRMMRQGYLREIAPELRRPRPALLDETGAFERDG